MESVHEDSELIEQEQDAQQEAPSGASTGQEPELWEREPVKLDRSMVESVMLAGLRWSAVRWREHPVLLDRGLECYRYLCGRFYDQGRRGFTHLPLFLIVDLLALIELGDRTPFASEGQAQNWEPRERRLRIDYENLLLGSLLQEPAFVEARERLPSKTTVRLVASQRLVEILLQSFGEHYPQWLEVDPSHLRDIAMPPVVDISPTQQLERMLERVGDEEIFYDALRMMLRGVAEHVYWKELLKGEDLFELENWEVLDTEAKRIGSRQISEVERRLGEVRLPRVKLRQEAMEVETDFDDDTTYPTGGFSGLTNRGSFENLVRSELVYMGEGHPISLFEMRFVENELLFYLRNDGVMRRKRRFIHFFIDLDAVFHAKSPGHEYPFSTLSQGLIVRVVRDLMQAFEDDAITLNIHYLFRPERQWSDEQTRKERERVEREMSLLALVLGREIRQESVAIDMIDDIDLEQLQQSRGRTYVIALVYNNNEEDFWRGLLKDLRRGKPPIFGLVLPIGVTKAGPEAYEDEVPLVLPIGKTPFAQVAEVKNQIFLKVLM